VIRSGVPENATARCESALHRLLDGGLELDDFRTVVRTP
jgi:hypothetical protein